MAWRSIHRFLTKPQFLLPSLIFPLFFFVAFAGGLSSVGDVPGFDFPSGYTAFQFVFVLLQASAFGGVFTGFSIAADFESGFARRMMLAAPNRLGILAGYGIAAAVRALIVGTMLFTIALLAGMQVDGGGVDLFGLIVLALIVNATALLWSAGVAMRLRTIQAGPVMQMPVFILLFLAPVYVPIDAAVGLDPHGGAVQSVHRARRGRPGADLRRRRARGGALRRRPRAAPGLRGVGRPRAAPRRGGGIAAGPAPKRRARCRSTGGLSGSRRSGPGSPHPDGLRCAR